jgi:hypothetical protein
MVTLAQRQKILEISAPAGKLPDAMPMPKPQPSLIVLAGDRAQSSYQEFINSGVGTTCVQNAHAARRFLTWAEGEGLAHRQIEPQHVIAFHRHLLDHHGHATAYGSSRFIRKFFAHLASSGAIDTNPAEEFAIRPVRPAPRIRKALAEEYGEDHKELADAILVMISPLEIGTFSLLAISRYTHLPLGFVETITGRLYDHGIWCSDQCIRCEWLDKDQEPGLAGLALLLDGYVAVGVLKRDDQLRYSLTAEYEQLESHTDQSLSIRTTVRETREITDREITQEVIVRGQQSGRVEQDPE